MSAEALTATFHKMVDFISRSHKALTGRGASEETLTNTPAESKVIQETSEPQVPAEEKRTLRKRPREPSCFDDIPSRYRPDPAYVPNVAQSTGSLLQDTLLASNDPAAQQLLSMETRMINSQFTVQTVKTLPRSVVDKLSVLFTDAQPIAIPSSTTPKKQKTSSIETPLYEALSRDALPYVPSRYPLKEDTSDEAYHQRHKRHTMQEKKLKNRDIEWFTHYRFRMQQEEEKRRHRMINELNSHNSRLKKEQALLKKLQEENALKVADGANPELPAVKKEGPQVCLIFEKDKSKVNVKEERGKLLERVKPFGLLHSSVSISIPEQHSCEPALQQKRSVKASSSTVESEKKSKIPTSEKKPKITSTPVSEKKSSKSTSGSEKKLKESTKLVKSKSTPSLLASDKKRKLSNSSCPAELTDAPSASESEMRTIVFKLPNKQKLVMPTKKPTKQRIELASTSCETLTSVEAVQTVESSKIVSDVLPALNAGRTTRNSRKASDAHSDSTIDLTGSPTTPPALPTSNPSLSTLSSSDTLNIPFDFPSPPKTSKSIEDLTVSPRSHSSPKPRGSRVGFHALRMSHIPPRDLDYNVVYLRDLGIL